MLVTSSCSTDETVVADSDVELENATSIRASSAVYMIDSAEDEGDTKTAPPVKDCKAENLVHVIESIEHDSRGKTDARTTEQGSQGFVPPKSDTFKPDTRHQSPIISDTSSKDRDEGIMTRKDKSHLSGSENPDIIYSQSLIVRDSNLSQLDCSSRNGPAVNFKRFRKVIDPLLKTKITNYPFPSCFWISRFFTSQTESGKIKSLNVYCDKMLSSYFFHSFQI